MAGLYIHIPFCHKACPYCDFYFLTNQKWKAPFIEALEGEIHDRAEELEIPIESIYFGGGTPSMLVPEEMARILECIEGHFGRSNEIELTIEANPEDLSEKNLESWKQCGINRLSIGVQTLNEEKLKGLGRNHKVQDSIEGLERAQRLGFGNISVDLIFATGDEKDLDSELDDYLRLDVQHISAYGLTVEEGTPLARLVGKGRKTIVEDDEYRRQFLLIHEKLESAGFGHYEISNYAKDGFESRHNSSYWNRKAYLGLGPSAHSYRNNSRRWNESNLPNYCKQIQFEEEALSARDQFNEAIMTGLRQKRGVDLAELSERFPAATKSMIEQSEGFIQDNLMEKNDNFLRLSLEGMLMSDHICSELFWIDED